MLSLLCFSGIFWQIIYSIIGRHKHNFGFNYGRCFF
uniref:Uncharacterized protein n=1 Tax=Arundo donax TaxID=35708 RepID=A0A0A9B3J1_ARUDO